MPGRIAAAAVALSLALAPAAAADATAAPTLSVDGSGSVFVTPDVASLDLSVDRSAQTSSAALGAANRRVDAIVGAIRALGVPAKGIQTNSINVSRDTMLVGPKGHRRRVRRFTAHESLSVTTTTRLLGPVIDTAVHEGADSVDGPSFSFSDPSAGTIAATRAALADARRQADAAAAAIGYQVVGVQSVNLNPQSTPTPVAGAPVSAGAPSKRGTPTTVHPGTQEVDATVAIVYIIAPTP
jgi:uncharacterized protein